MNLLLQLPTPFLFGPCVELEQVVHRDKVVQSKQPEFELHADIHNHCMLINHNILKASIYDQLDKQTYMYLEKEHITYDKQEKIKSPSHQKNQLLLSRLN